VTSRALAAESINPFATRRTRSGMVPYRFSDGEYAAGIIERLRAAGWWGQVVGPHGSGKSTLLATLLPELSRQAVQVLVARLYEEYRQLPSTMETALRRTSRIVPGCLLVIDGYEQLSLWDRRRLRRHCKRLGYGLLVSAHRRLWGLPVVYRTRATYDLAWRVVRYLLREQACPFTAEDIAARLRARQGNVRELLFDLYDWYEAGRR
jgi:hypothetical protein